MSAKLLSLVVVVLLLHVAINTLPGLWLPVASPFGYVRAAFALQVALLMQTVFACGAIVALQGLVSLALPAGDRAARLARSLQAAILLAAALLFVAEGAISRLAFAMRDGAHLVNWIVPVVWFRAVYVRLLGVDSAPLAAQARLARRGDRRGRGGGRSLQPARLPRRPEGDGGPALRRRTRSRASARCSTARRAPVARAVSSFVSAALLRSPSAGLIARGFFVVGLALTLQRASAASLCATSGTDAPVIPAEPLHAPAFVLPFFALVGLRLSAVYPASLEANWIFRLTEATGSTDYAAGRAVGGAAHVVAAAARPPGGPVRALLGPGRWPPPTCCWRSPSRS